MIRLLALPGTSKPVKPRQLQVRRVVSELRGRGSEVESCELTNAMRSRIEYVSTVQCRELIGSPCNFLLACHCGDHISASIYQLYLHASDLAGARTALA